MKPPSRVSLRKLVLGVLTAGLLVLLGLYGTWVYFRLWLPHVEHAAAAEVKARVGGKYDTLLRRLRVPQDRQNYTDFRDYGYWSGNAYAGYNNLPQGYWVYVYPYWFIWGNAAAEEQPQVGASEQVTR